jgi:hypothetical protein
MERVYNLHRAVDRLSSVGVNTIMQARLLLRERLILGEDRFAEMVIWQMPRPVPGSAHGFKYRLAFVVDEICVLRFDNEAGKEITSISAPRRCPTPLPASHDW